MLQLTDPVAELCNAFHAGDLKQAQALHYELLPLHNSMFVETNPMPVKAVLAAMGLIKNVLRLPLTPMLPDNYDSIQPILKNAGLI